MSGRLNSLVTLTPLLVSSLSQGLPVRVVDRVRTRRSDTAGTPMGVITPRGDNTDTAGPRV